jgi:hypothetical protein
MRDDSRRKEKNGNLIICHNCYCGMIPSSCPSRIMCGFYSGNMGKDLQLRLSTVSRASNLSKVLKSKGLHSQAVDDRTRGLAG